MDKFLDGAKRKLLVWRAPEGCFNKSLGLWREIIGLDKLYRDLVRSANINVPWGAVHPRSQSARYLRTVS